VLIISLSRQLLKIVANLLKVCCYAFHALFPRKRFDIPYKAAAFLRNDKNRLVPRVLWQTNFTNRVTLPVYLNYLFNRVMSPTHAYRFMSDEDAAEFIQEHYPREVFQAYSKLQIGAARADFWRVLVLQKFGGVYLDMDAHLVWPIEKIVKAGQGELYLKIKTGEISNYFMASKPNNLNLAKLIDRIRTNIERSSSMDVYSLTGPGVFNDVFAGIEVPTRDYKYTCNQGNFTNEHFQYMDKPQGKWTREQERVDVIRKESDSA
jgi:mannosyltransferase OCH1-like enzyme